MIQEPRVVAARGVFAGERTWPSSRLSRAILLRSKFEDGDVLDGGVVLGKVVEF